MKRESELKAAFRAELERQLPRFLMLHLLSTGGPDRAIVGAGRTTYWEFKHATPGFDSKGDQALWCMRLDHHGGWCRYVIWQEEADGSDKRTMIVDPRTVHERDSCRVVPEAFCVGYDHRWLVEQVRKAHRI